MSRETISGVGPWTITLVDGRPVRVAVERDDSVLVMAMRVHRSVCARCGGPTMAVTPENEDEDICWECEKELAT